MTAKEKAQELINKYIEPAKSYYSPIEWKEKNYKAKKCALIAVEEILDDDMFDMSEELFVKRIEYWQQVKEEIENF